MQSSVHPRTFRRSLKCIERTLLVAVTGLLSILAACSTTTTSAPAVKLPTAPRTAGGVARGFKIALPHATWPGGWHFTKPSTSEGSESEAASITLGSAADVGPLTQSGFKSLAGVEFEIEPSVQNDAGNGGLSILEFSTTAGAEHFYKLWQRSSGSPIPGVPFGDYDGEDEPSTCPSQCGVGGFVLAVDQFVIDGGLNCQFHPGCTQLAADFAQSVYRSMTAK